MWSRVGRFPKSETETNNEGRDQARGATPATYLNQCTSVNPLLVQLVQTRANPNGQSCEETVKSQLAKGNNDNDDPKAEKMTRMARSKGWIWTWSLLPLSLWLHQFLYLVHLVIEHLTKGSRLQLNLGSNRRDSGLQGAHTLRSLLGCVDGCLHLGLKLAHN